MSHWYRLPRAFSLKYFLERSKRDLILDEPLYAYKEVFRSLSRTVLLIPDLCLKEHTVPHIAAVCQKRQGILATTNSDCINELNKGSPKSWGLLLVPESEVARQEILNSLFSGVLTIRPSTERSITAEHAPFSALFFDLRQSPPVVGVFYRCQQSRDQRRS
jgi:hypothetical protein